MSQSHTSSFTPDPLTDVRLYQGVRTRRIMAFLLDVVLLAILTFFAGVLILFLGVLTAGLGWLLYIVLWPVLALVYYAYTLGGPKSATPGMQAFGLEMRQLNGAPMTPVLAAIHSVLFYASVSILTPFVLVVALISDRKRLLHDIVLGTVVVNRIW